MPQNNDSFSIITYVYPKKYFFHPKKMVEPRWVFHTEHLRWKGAEGKAAAREAGRLKHEMDSFGPAPHVFVKSF